MHTTIQIAADVAQKIGVVAHRMHQSPEACVHQALTSFLEDQEDYFLALSAWEEHKKNGSKTIGLEEMCQRLGIQDL